MPTTAPVFTGRQRLALLAGFALLVALRLPLTWVHGRFFGEEGRIFLAYAWRQPAGVALLRSFGGYLNLAANAATLLTARLVRPGGLPLEYAPYVTMTIALLCQLLPAILVLTARGAWLTTRAAVVATLLILVISPKTEEVFLNVLHIQFHLALCVALILALDIPPSRRARAGYWALLLLAPLCGPGAMVLLPFFALRTLVDRDPARAAQTAVLAVGTAIQLLLFFTPSAARGHVLDPATLAAVMVLRLAALPLLTVPIANVLGALTYLSYTAAGAGWWLATIAALGYFGTLVALALRDRRDAAIWLILPGLAVGAVSFGGGMIAVDSLEWFSPGAGERYNFLPLVLVSLGVVVLATRSGTPYRRICIVLCLLTLMSGAIAYPTPSPKLGRGPAWSDEVAAWRRDHNHLLAAWQPFWSVDLSDRNRPCPPARRTATASSDPGYCESNWLVQLKKR